MLNRDKRIAAFLVAAAFAIVCWIAPAQADGLPKSALLPLGEVAKAGSWTGCYVGASVGYGWTRSEFTTYKNEGANLNLDEVLISPAVGCDIQASNLVFGILADVSWSNMSSTALDADWQWFAGGRAGFLASPKTLVYGLIGYTALDGGLSFNKTSPGDLKGLTYGGGIEQLISGGWSLKLEYRYVQFGDDTAQNGVNDGLKDGTDIDTGTHQARFGVVYRFGQK